MNGLHPFVVFLIFFHTLFVAAVLFYIASDPLEYALSFLITFYFLNKARYLFQQGV